MTRIYVLIVISFLSKQVSAQIETGVLKAGTLIKVKLKPEIAEQSLGGGVLSLQLLDYRDDTTSLGYNHTAFNNKETKCNFEYSAITELTDWLCGYLKISKENVTENKLIISLKKIRLSEEMTPVFFDNGHQGQGENGWEQGIVTKMEFYLQKDSFFYPLYRFDSLITMDKKLPENADEFIVTALQTAMTKLFTINFEVIQARAKKLSFNDILVYNKKNTDVPILNGAAYKRGAYKNFEEFKTNNPSIVNFEFKEGQAGDFLYVKENGSEYPERTAWGFCDGKDIFINSADKFSKLIKDGNTFYFKGIKSITRKAKHRVMKTSLFNIATNSGEKRTSYKAKLKYYQLDMETGEAY
ncbi:hypothetical protein [Ferruginibacter sp.]|nr:hypothetical protein [Ferruginibacter sp.]